MSEAKISIFCDFVDFVGWPKCGTITQWNTDTGMQSALAILLFGWAKPDATIGSHKQKQRFTHTMVKWRGPTFVVLPNWTTAIVENDRLQVHVAQIGIVAACVAADSADGTRRWPFLLIAPNRPAGRKHVRLIEATECGIENLFHKLYGRYLSTMFGGSHIWIFGKCRGDFSMWHETWAHGIYLLSREN